MRRTSHAQRRQRLLVEAETPPPSAKRAKLAVLGGTEVDDDDIRALIDARRAQTEKDNQEAYARGVRDAVFAAKMKEVLQRSNKDSGARSVYSPAKRFWEHEATVPISS